MPTRTEIERQRQFLMDRLAYLNVAEANLERHAATIATLEGADDGTVIRYRRTYPGNRTQYRYAAIKAGGRWWLTGRDSAGSDRQLTTGVLVDLVLEGRVTNIQVARKWRTITED